jgi:hypothetical protein
MSVFGLIWDVRTVSDNIRESNRVDPKDSN